MVQMVVGMVVAMGMLVVEVVVGPGDVRGVVVVVALLCVLVLLSVL